MWFGNSVIRFGDLLHFGQLFKACGMNYFAQITHIFRQFFVKLPKSFIFIVESFLGIFYRHLATFYCSHCLVTTCKVVNPDISPSSDSSTMLPSLEPSGLVQRTRSLLFSVSVSVAFVRNVFGFGFELSVRQFKSDITTTKTTMMRFNVNGGVDIGTIISVLWTS